MRLAGTVTHRGDKSDRKSVPPRLGSKEAMESRHSSWPSAERPDPGRSTAGRCRASIEDDTGCGEVLPAGSSARKSPGDGPGAAPSLLLGYRPGESCTPKPGHPRSS